MLGHRRPVRWNQGLGNLPVRPLGGAGKIDAASLDQGHSSTVGGEGSRIGRTQWRTRSRSGLGLERLGGRAAAFGAKARVRFLDRRWRPQRMDAKKVRRRL